jgi:hypothetical protein
MDTPTAEAKFMELLRELASRAGLSYGDIASRSQRLPDVEPIPKSTVHYVLRRDVVPKRREQIHALVMVLVTANHLTPMEDGTQLIDAWASLISRRRRRATAAERHAATEAALVGEDFVDAVPTTAATEPAKPQDQTSASANGHRPRWSRSRHDGDPRRGSSEPQVARSPAPWRARVVHDLNRADPLRFAVAIGVLLLSIAMSVSLVVLTLHFIGA